MMSHKKAFTLIELVVMVLIVGVIAAISLPRYHFAVEKGRATKALVKLLSIADANRRYLLEHKTYNPDDILTLDVDIPGKIYTYCSKVRKYDENFDYGTQACRSASIAVVNRLPMGGDNSYYMYVTPEGKVYCVANADGSKAIKICKALGADEQGVLHF